MSEGSDSFILHHGKKDTSVEHVDHYVQKRSALNEVFNGLYKGITYPIFDKIMKRLKDMDLN